ncbi:MAG: phospholipase D-like domain-containing protein [Ferruginibacter sp.]|nr:phospholipase D-like domain-containing protein [Ferruginibacter sp.]
MGRTKKRKLTAWFSEHNSVQLIKGGARYFEQLVELIESARETIHLQTYIYNDDETGREVGRALLAAVARDVQVYLLADGYASRKMSPQFIAALKEGGVNFRFFEPLFRSRYFYFGRRLHHKLVVVDATRAMVGGINIGDHYNDRPERPGWLDFALLVQGEIARDLCILSCKTWRGFGRDKFVTPCGSASRLALKKEEEVLIRMRRNDWVNNKHQISRTYIEMMLNARSSIFILCSYFLPGTIIRKAIRRASDRGVKITVIVAGKSDLLVAKNAEKYMYDWLLRNKVELYEYQRNILHGKMAVCDGEWLTLGSYNINDISAYASVELNLDVRNKQFAVNVEETLQAIIKEDCIPISEQVHRQSTNTFKQFFRWISYIVFRALLFLFTFYLRPRR